MKIKFSGNSENLLKSLFKNYDKRIRPYADNGTAVIVHMTIVLGILIELVSICGLKIGKIEKKILERK